MALPYPTGPYRMTDSPGCSQRSAARSRIWAAGSFGMRRGRILPGWRGLEPGGADTPLQRGGFPAGDLVLAQDLEEVQVAEVPGAGLGQAGVRVSSMPDSFSSRSAAASALRSVMVAVVMMAAAP